MASLAKATTEQLLAELQRRLKCADKPEKKTIFIGTVHSATGGLGGVHVLHVRVYVRKCRST